MRSSIDVHSHFVTEEYVKYLKLNHGLLEDGMPLPKWDETSMLQFMEQGEIEQIVLSVSSPHPYYCARKEEGKQLCHRLNEEMAAIKKRYPEKIHFLAVLPLPDVNAALEEAQYAIDILKADGVKLASNSRGQYLGDKELELLFQFLNEKNAILSIHPHRPEPMATEVYTERVIPLFEFLCDTTRAVINMICNGVVDRYPDLKIIVPHCGSFLPNIADRANGFLVHMKNLGRVEEDIHFAENLKKLYYDLSGNPVPDLLPLLLKIADPNHIMYGSDYPFTPGPVCLENKERLEAFLEKEELYQYKNRILYENAKKLFERNSMF